MKIPFIDLHAQYQSIKPDIDLAIADTIKNSAFIKSPSVSAFEKDFGQFLGVENVIACGNGTDAIEIILQAMGLGPGDEVLVPALTWISTSEAVAGKGATPIFVDIDPETYTIDHKLIQEKITERTKAIIPVHLYGHPAQMREIMRISKKHKIKVIEDCAQAHGAEIDGQKVGSFGDAATFSFFPTKNLGAFGDAGAMVSNDRNLAENARAIANHGQTKRHHHELDGRNSRMDGLQATILSVKLKHLEGWTSSRVEKAACYQTLLKGNAAVHLPITRKGRKHVFHLYVIRTKERDELKAYLAENGVASMIHYPKALPFQPAYSYQNNTPAAFPVAAEYQKSILSLPIYPELRDETIEKVAELISNFHK